MSSSYLSSVLEFPQASPGPQPRTRHKYPSRYQINTRASLQELSRHLRRKATLDDIPDSELDRLASHGFDWAWFLGVWRTGAAGARFRARTKSGATNSSKLCLTCKPTRFADLVSRLRTTRWRPS
jgi:hypothetical protein